MPAKAQSTAPPDGTEGLFQLVAEHHRHQIIGAGARLGTDDDGHAEGQDPASCHQQSQPSEKRQSGGFVPLSQQLGEYLLEGRIDLPELLIACLIPGRQLRIRLHPAGHFHQGVCRGLYLSYCPQPTMASMAPP